ncbi:MAG: hypothetical protein H7246_20065 [Phycisphaerae bacterium]|nr:hypothetical protein [Saprospiraceae bacterium]
MKKQIILIAFFIIGITLIEACSCFTSCGCGGAPEVPNFFDFKKLSVETKQGIGTESLRIEMIPDSIEYLAMRVPELPVVGFTSAAYGCSPNEPGYGGLKFPLTKINITANRLFNDTLPAGTSLNALFLMTTEPYIDQPDREFGSAEVASVNALEMFPPFRGGYYESVFFLVTKEHPSNPALPFKFTITMSKSDSSSVAITTEDVFF